MALQFRRGTSTERGDANFVPDLAEPIYETDTNKLYIGDGVTSGGNQVGLISKLEDIGDVVISSETVFNPNFYSITSEVVTIQFPANHTIPNGAEILIANASESTLNGTYVATNLNANSLTIPKTGAADIGSTALTANITQVVETGSSLRWNNLASTWEDYLPALDSLSDVDLTTPATNGQILSFDGTNFIASDFSLSLDTNPQLGGNLDVNSHDIVSASNGDIDLAPDGTGAVTVKGNATGGSGKITLNCEQNTHGVTIQGPPHSAAATYTLVLPSTVGSAGEVLATDGSGNTSWTTGGSGSGLATRTTASATTSTIADGVSADISITGFKSYMLMSIQTSAAAWVTVYTSAAARTADASRTISTDPLPGSGVVAEVITGSATTQKITPGLLGFNDDSTVTTDIYLKVENQSGSAAAIAVSLTLLKLEV